VVLGSTTLLVLFLVKLTPKRWAETYIKAPVDETHDVSEGRALMAVHRMSQQRLSTAVRGKIVITPLSDEAKRENSSETYSSQGEHRQTDSAEDYDD